MYRKSVEWHQSKNFSIVHCRSYVPSLVGNLLKKKYGLKFIFDMRGFWADERVEGGLWNTGNPIFALMYRYFKRKEKVFFISADSVIVLTEAAQQEVLSQNPHTPVSVIPCCVDMDLFNPTHVNDKDKAEVRNQLGLTHEHFILLYLGSLGTWYLYKDMVTFFRRLKIDYPMAKFLFLTHDKEGVESDPDFIVLTVSRKDVPKYINACDASICFISPSFSKKGSSATKMAEVLAMGIPMISNSGWGDVEYLAKHVGGLFLVSGPEHLPDMKTLSTAAIREGNDFFYEHFSLSSGIDGYKAVYQILETK